MLQRGGLGDAPNPKVCPSVLGQAQHLGKGWVLLLITGSPDPALHPWVSFLSFPPCHPKQLSWGRGTLIHSVASPALRETLPLVSRVPVWVQAWVFCSGRAPTPRSFGSSLILGAQGAGQVHDHRFHLFLIPCD